MPRTIINAQGQEEPFDQSKVVASILNALRKAEYRDETEADHIAPMVEYALSRYFGERPPTVNDVAHCIEQALRSLPGLMSVADAYVDARQRSIDLAAIEDGVTLDVKGPRVASRTDYSLHGWDRARLEAALVREHGLPLAQAMEIAGVVEMQVNALALEEVSTSLLRELVDAQLDKHGVLAGDFGIGQLSLPTWDIEQAIFPQEESPSDSSLDTPEELERFVAQAVMRQFTWRRVHHAGVREATLDAKMAFADSGQPQRFHRISLDARELLGASAGYAGLAFFAHAVSSIEEAIDRLVTIAQFACEHASSEVELRSLDTALAPLIRTRGEEAGMCRVLRARFGEFAKKSARVALGFDALAGRMDRAGSLDFLNAWLQDALDDPESARSEVESRVAIGEATADDPHCRAALRLASEAAVLGRSIRFTFDRPRRSGRRRGLFGDTSPKGESREVVSAAASLNLVQPLLANPNPKQALGESAVLERLGDALALLMEGLSERDAFARRFHLRRRDALPSQSELLGRYWADESGVVEVAFVGLHEYARAISQNAEPDSDLYRSAIDRLLGFLTLRSSELCDDLGLDVRFVGSMRARQASAALSNASRRTWPERYEEVAGAMSRELSSGANLPSWMPIKARARLGLEGRLHSVLKSSLVVLSDEAEAIKSADLTEILLSTALAADAKVRALCYQVSMRQCARCAIMARPEVRVCPACGSREWRVPRGQKMLFDSSLDAENGRDP